MFAASGMADDTHGGRGHFEREDQHSIPFLETDNEGNETAGQIAAWLLLVANLPVALSIRDQVDQIDLSLCGPS